MKRQGTVITYAQQKGGVGKTTNSYMEAMVASFVFQKKVLYIDVDAQMDGTTILGKTFRKEEFPNSFLKCVIELGDLSKGIYKLHDNLDIIPGQTDMREFIPLLTEKFPDKSNPQHIIDRTFYVSTLLEKVKYNYDYVIIDTPPGIDLKVDNLMVASDYIVLIQETQQLAFEASQKIIASQIQTLVDDFGPLVKTQIAGILTVLLQPKRPLHKSIMEKTIATFGEENIFQTTVNNHARLEWYPVHGVLFQDHHDKKMFALYSDIFCELEERIHLYETVGDVKGYKYQPKYIVNNKMTKLGKGIVVDGLN